MEVRIAHLSGHHTEQGYLSITRQVCVLLGAEAQRGLGTVSRRKGHIVSQRLQSEGSLENVGTCLKKADVSESINPSHNGMS